MGYPLENQISTAKITGAFAHELCNPLQGVRSLIEVIHRSSAHEADLSRKLERVEDGMNRLAGVLDAFRVTYENLPRPADHVSVDSFVSEIAESIQRCGATLSRDDDYPPDSYVYAFAPELATLISHALIDHSPAPVHIALHSKQLENTVAFFSEIASAAPLIMPWIDANNSDGLAGLPILIDEITRQCGGAANFRYDDFGLRSIRIDLPISL
ncbi:hypothetical protein KKC97_05370 [bacterium]|nr:hypothetical protein [bacterium]MBU1637079.1 hypothetical protein [bacterium]MBU1921227.1 hypothetical protein [bacterium]